ncbi:hypothetical protein BC831DRAFT_498936 [Entophlyctis helioformis]|nr:hypothetical protein BC831DRAFT_498936 [Entophlyctis helioformis]
MPITQTICLDLLIQGHIGSYIEFFHMVVENKFAIDVSRDMLGQLKVLLTIAEDSQRSGTAKAIYESKKNLAQFFTRSVNYDIAITYFKEALETARRMQNEYAIEVEATRNLGVALEGAGKVHEALEYFETSRSLALERNNVDGEMMASQSLVNVHVAIAEKFENAGDYEQAIQHFTKCLEFLKHGANDERSICDIEFRLGKAHKEIGKIEVAIKYLESFVAKSATMGDKNKEGWAHATLAACYDISGNPQLAASYLQQFVSIAESDPRQRLAESQACNQLGMLYNKLGEFDMAVTYFERHFRLMTDIAKEDALVAAEESAAAAANSGGGTVSGVGGADGDGASDDMSVASHARDRTNIGAVGGSDPAAVGHAGAASGSGGLAAVAHAPVAKDFGPKSSKGSLVRFGAAQAQLGISRGNAQMALFFETVVDPNGLGPLLQWKAERSFGAYVPQRSGMIN